MNKFIVGVCTVIEVGCILALAGIGLKRNNDCYKAEVKLGEARMDLAASELKCFAKDLEIDDLKRKLEKVKA